MRKLCLEFMGFSFLHEIKNTPKRETLDSAYKQGQNSEGLSLLRLESHTTLCEKSMTFLKKHLNFL